MFYNKILKKISLVFAILLLTLTIVGCNIKVSNTNVNIKSISCVSGDKSEQTLTDSKTVKTNFGVPYSKVSSTGMSGGKHAYYLCSEVGEDIYYWNGDCSNLHVDKTLENSFYVTANNEDAARMVFLLIQKTPNTYEFTVSFMDYSGVSWYLKISENEEGIPYFDMITTQYNEASKFTYVITRNTIEFEASDYSCYCMVIDPTTLKVNLMKNTETNADNINYILQLYTEERSNIANLLPVSETGGTQVSTEVLTSDLENYIVMYKSSEDISFTINLDNPKGESIDAVELSCNDPDASIKVYNSDGSYTWEKLSNDNRNSYVINWASENAYTKTFYLKTISSDNINTLTVTDLKVNGVWQNKALDNNELKIYKIDDETLTYNIIFNCPDYIVLDVNYDDTKIIDIAIPNTYIDTNGNYVVPRKAFDSNIISLDIYTNYLYNENTYLFKPDTIELEFMYLVQSEIWTGDENTQSAKAIKENPYTFCQTYISSKGTSLENNCYKAEIIRPITEDAIISNNLEIKSIVKTSNNEQTYLRFGYIPTTYIRLTYDSQIPGTFANLNYCYPRITISDSNNLYFYAFYADLLNY